MNCVYNVRVVLTFRRYFSLHIVLLAQAYVDIYMKYVLHVMNTCKRTKNNPIVFGHSDQFDPSRYFNIYFYTFFTTVPVAEATHPDKSESKSQTLLHVAIHA